MTVTQDQVGLFLYPGDADNRFDIDDFDQVMAQIENSLSEKKRFIFLVHGRGDHPEKAYDKEILKDLEEQYNAEVLMFQWPSHKESGNKFPKDRAKAASIFLRTVLERFRNYKERDENRGQWGTIKTTLLAHSMGNIVLQNMIESQNDGLGQNLFDNVILNAAAVSLIGHREWVDRIDFSNNVYISMYLKDGVLKRARKYIDGPILGRQVKFFKKNPQHQSDRAKYLLLIKPGVNFFKSHKYYVGIKKKRPISKVYKNIISDESDPLKVKGVSEFRSRVYEIRKR